MSNMFDVNIADKKTILRGLRFAIVISLAISALIILITMDKSSLKQIITDIKKEYIFYIIVIMLLNWVFAGLRLKTLVETIDGNISLKDSIVIYLSGAFVSNVTPFATGGGPFQIYFLHKKGVNVGKSSTAIVIQFVLRLFYLGLLTPIFIIFFNKNISSGVLPNYLFYMAFGFGVLVSIAIIILILVPSITGKLINLIFKIRKLKNFLRNSHKAKRWLVKARSELREFRNSLEVMSRYKGRLCLAGVYTALYWSTIFLVIPLILKGLGLESYIFRSYVMQTIFYLVLPYTPLPGASGLAEVGFASIFVAFIPGNLIGLVTFAWRLFTFYLILLVGGFFALREISKKRINKS